MAKSARFDMTLDISRF